MIGTIHSALFLGEARETHLRDCRSSPFEHEGVCDEWFVDDGQCFVRPWAFDGWLRTLDAALAAVAATRGCVAHGNVKSSARLLCPLERTREFFGLGHSVRARHSLRPQPRFGHDRVGDRGACLSLAAVAQEHGPCPHLMRWCSPGSALTYPSSCISCAPTETFWITTWWPPTTDNFVLLSAPLFAGLATRSGLWRPFGLRTAIGVALLAFVASRIVSRFLVTTVVDHVRAAFGGTSRLTLAEYDTRTGEALSRLVIALPAAAVQELLAQLDEALSEHELLWQNVLTGSVDAIGDRPSPSFRHAWGITP